MLSQVAVDCTTGEVVVENDTFLALKPAAVAAGATGANPGVGAGTGAVVSLLGGSRDTLGAGQLTAGTNPSAGDIINVTFGTPRAVPPMLIAVYALNVAAGVLYAANISATGFSICSQSAPDAGTQYTLGWHLV